MDIHEAVSFESFGDISWGSKDNVSIASFSEVSWGSPEDIAFSGKFNGTVVGHEDFNVLYQMNNRGDGNARLQEDHDLHGRDTACIQEPVENVRFYTSINTQSCREDEYRTLFSKYYDEISSQVNSTVKPIDPSLYDAQTANVSQQQETQGSCCKQKIKDESYKYFETKPANHDQRSSYENNHYAQAETKKKSSKTSEKEDSKLAASKPATKEKSKPFSTKVKKKSSSSKLSKKQIKDDKSLCKVSDSSPVVNVMAGLCGCWKLSSNGHCDGCGYKVLIRGALNSGYSYNPSKCPGKTQAIQKPIETQATSAFTLPGKAKKDKKEHDKKFSTIETPIRQLQSSPSQHRRHSHPFHTVEQKPTEKIQSQSLQRRPHGSHPLPQSSAYNVPLPPKKDKTGDWSGSHDGTGYFGGYRDGRPPGSIYQHRRGCSHGGSFPHQMMLSTIQPPADLCPSQPISQSSIDSTTQEISEVGIDSPSPFYSPQLLDQNIVSLASSPSLSPRPPPFDLNSFLPPVSPRIPPIVNTGGTFFGAGFPGGPCASSTSLQIRYQALSLARASSRSHSDLREETMENGTSISPGGSRPNSVYSSYTLPAPPPPPREKRYIVRRPQEVWLLFCYLNAHLQYL